MNLDNILCFMVNSVFSLLRIKVGCLFLAPAFIILFLLGSCKAQGNGEKVAVDQARYPFHHLPFTIAALNDSTLGIVPDGRRLVLYNFRTGKVVHVLAADTIALFAVFNDLKKQGLFEPGQQLLAATDARDLGVRPAEIVSVYKYSPDSFGLITGLLSIINRDSNGTSYKMVRRDFFDQIYPMGADGPNATCLLNSGPFNPVANFEVLYQKGQLCMPHIRALPSDTLDQVVCFAAADRNIRNVAAQFLEVDSIAVRFSANRKLQRYSFSTFNDEIWIGTDQCVYLFNGEKNFCLPDYGLSGSITRLYKKDAERLYFFTDQKDTCRLYSINKSEPRPQLLKTWPYPASAVFQNNEIIVLTKEPNGYYFQTFHLSKFD